MSAPENPATEAYGSEHPTQSIPYHFLHLLHYLPRNLPVAGHHHPVEVSTRPPSTRVAKMGAYILLHYILLPTDNRQVLLDQLRDMLIPSDMQKRAIAQPIKASDHHKMLIFSIEAQMVV